LIQIITGPRQIGKSTAAAQIEKKWKGEVVFVSADSPLPPGPEWIRHHWERAQSLKSENRLLIIDEIQKVDGWSETIKSLWDEDKRSGSVISILLLGSSSLLIQKGLSESLSGRFFLHRMNHWQYHEASAAFNLSLSEWIYYGGYPGSYSFLNDEYMWKTYIRDSLIETVLTRDVLNMQNITKPALLRHLFMLSTAYPAQILSYNKMLGQLTNAGNTTTLAHYVHILESAYLLSGLELFKIGERPKRGSSPKLILWNNALVNALSPVSFDAARSNPEQWGRLVENAVGASLLNEFRGLPYKLYYWRKNDMEVDFVLHTPFDTWAIEVKSSRGSPPKGLQHFTKLYPKAKPVLIGGSGISLEEFFITPKRDLFGS
jgi:uncharacterized protein